MYADSFFYGLHENSIWQEATSCPLEKGIALELREGLVDANVALYHHRFSIIPEREFDEKEVVWLMDSAGVSFSNARVKYDRLSGLDAVIIYPFDQFHEAFLNQNIAQYHLQHLVTSLLHSLQSNSIQSIIHIHLVGKEMILLVKKENRLLFANTFAFSAPESVLYYITLLRQLYSLENDYHIEVAGASEKVQACGDLLGQYYFNVRSVNATEPVVRSADPQLALALEIVGQCAS